MRPEPELPSHRIRPPRQQRSRQTLERLLEAAEQLVAEQGIDRTTVVEVARRADSSVGALYARFEDKEALIRAVFERFYRQSCELADRVFDHESTSAVPLPELVCTAIETLLRIFREQRRLIAGFTVRAASSPELGALGERLGLHVADRAHRFLVQRGAPIVHPDPEQAVRFAVMMVLSALEARALYTPQAAQLLPEDAAAKELTRMCLAYLGLPTEAGREEVVT